MEEHILSISKGGMFDKVLKALDKKFNRPIISHLLLYHINYLIFHILELYKYTYGGFSLPSTVATPPLIFSLHLRVLAQLGKFALVQITAFSPWFSFLSHKRKNPSILKCVTLNSVRTSSLLIGQMYQPCQMQGTTKVHTGRRSCVVDLWIYPAACFGWTKNKLKSAYNPMPSNHAIRSFRSCPGSGCFLIRRTSPDLAR